MTRCGSIASSAPWYADGLRFSCTQCGNCCSGAPGYVWVTAEEIRALAKRHDMSVPTFQKKYVRKIGDEWSLKELADGDCVFLKRTAGGKAICSVYEDRPAQCRTWPFWTENVQTPEAWGHVAEDCPGVNRGEFHSLPVIQAALSVDF